MPGERFSAGLTPRRRRRGSALPLDITGGIPSISCSSSAFSTSAAVARLVVLGPLATLLLNVLPCFCCARRGVSSIGRLPIARRFRSLLPDESFPVEVTLVQRSLQPPPVSCLRMPGGHVVLALARHLQVELLQRPHHAGAVGDRTGGHAGHQVLPDQLPRVRLHLPPRPQRLRVQIRPVRRWPVRPSPRRVVRPAPAVLEVQGVAERVERLLPAGRGDVQAPPCREVAARREDVKVHPAVMVAVQDHRPDVAVPLEARPGGLLELVDDPLEFGPGRGVLGRPGHQARRVPVLEGKAVGDRRDLVRIPAQDLDRRAARARSIPLGEKVGRGRGRRARAPG